MALYPATLHGPAALTAVALTSAPPVYAAASSVTGGGASVTIVKQIIVCNTGAAGTFSLYLGTATAPAANNALFEAVALGAGETKIINTSLVLRGSQKLFARASAATVILTLVGLEEY